MILLRRYEVIIKMKFTATDDSRDKYKAYGSMSADFGTLSNNQGKLLWERKRSDPLSIENNHFHKIDRTRSFSEYMEFSKTGRIKFYGKVHFYSTGIYGGKPELSRAKSSR